MAEEKPQAPEPQQASESQKKTVKIILIVIGALIVLGLIGTALLGFIGAKIGTSVIERATDSDVNVSDDGVTIESDDGSFSARSDATLPEDFPEIVPLFEPASVDTSSKIGRADRGSMWIVSFTTESSVDEVYDFYIDQLDEDNWETVSTFESGDMKNLSASNETENTQVQLSLTGDNSENLTTYSVTVSRETDQQ
jgi:hypothetical protein